MFSAEQLSSAGFLISSRSRNERLIDGMVYAAASATATFALEHGETYSAMPSPVALQERWDAEVTRRIGLLDFPDSEVAMLLKELREDSLPSEMHASGTAALSFAMTSGYSAVETRNLLREAMDMDSGTMELTAAARIFGWRWRSRIRRTARTLGTRFTGWLVQNGTWILGIEHKRWVTRRDDAVRESHAAVDGLTIPRNQFFPVGGYSLEYPGDSSGPTEEIMNCRCVLTAVLRP